MHVGLPKCGSTAFQQSLQVTRAILEPEGIRPLVYEGPAPDPGLPTRAVNLAAAVVRPDLDAWFRLVVPETQVAGFVAECADSVRRQARSAEPLLVASMEDLCLIRTRHEVERLVELLAPRQVSVVVVLRDERSYRRSLRSQLARAGLRTWSPVRDSCLNTSADSWLFDQGALVDVLSETLGRGAVTTIAYERAVADDGSIVPALWRACGLPERTLVEAGWHHEWSNVSRGSDGADIDSEDDIEVLRDRARRLQAENDRIQMSYLWRLTRPLGRIRRYLARVSGPRRP